MTQKKAIIWFRQDLRLTDNPALSHAVDEGYKIIPLFILDDDSAGDWLHGAASRYWLHHSLKALNQSLDNTLIFRHGDASKIIPELVEATLVEAVFWNRCYEPWRIKRDKVIKEELKNNDIACETFNGSLLWEPWEPLKGDGTPYKVFTPFYRKGCLKHSEPSEPLPAPDNIEYAYHECNKNSLSDLNLLPDIRWDKKMEKHFTPGEQGAKDRLQAFLDEGLVGYKEGRNVPSLPNVSRLSPYLHWGEISPRTVWQEAKSFQAAHGYEKDVDHFCSELGWREFSHSLLYHFPDLPRKALQEKFENFPWQDVDQDKLKAWQKGRTGFPIVDAGMRELWETGYMHNRMRMIVGSFLVKNMLIHWHHGEEWFWDCLVDADLANNSASWQWIAGCGADAAPYFRIFNPILQSHKFDPNGDYIRRFVPELKDVPNDNIHEPWDAPDGVLRMAGVTLGETYPHRILDLGATRDRALEAYGKIKGT